MTKILIKKHFRGARTQYKVENLAPCTCYSFRIKLCPESDWVYFKAATADDGPYSLVMHMSRAVKMGKTPLIRKMAHTRRSDDHNRSDLPNWKRLGDMQLKWDGGHKTRLLYVLDCITLTQLGPTHSKWALSGPHLLEAENKENKSPLIQAIEGGDIQIVQLLIILGANVNNPMYYNKRTPLMSAIYRNQLHIAGILIDKGADVYAVDINGLNILHHAVDSNNIDNVKFALGTGIDINSRDNHGLTPLLRAVISNASDEIISLLLENGADKNLKDKNGLDFDKHRAITMFPEKFPKKWSIRKMIFNNTYSC
ncbi:hypothetical protein NQ318_009472, partial [Aromia moschata]